MTQALRSYLLGVTAAALLGALCMGLLPKGSIRRSLGFCCAMLLALTMIRPLLKLDSKSLAQSIARLQMQAETARTGVEVKNRELVAEIIKQSAETYILDKASSMGLEASVEVTVEGEMTYPYPAAVCITANAAEAQRKQLGSYISENLAIPAERQTWKTETQTPQAD